ILYQSTCVGFGYGLCGGYFLEPLHRMRNPVTAIRFLEFVTTRWPRNIHLVPIDYAFRPRLRDRLTLRRLPLRRNPWTFGGNVFHTVFVTHVSSRASDTSRSPHGSSFAGLRNAPLPLVLRRTQSFGAWFEPRYIFGAGTLI